MESVSARDPIHIAPTFTGGNATVRSRVGVDSCGVSRGLRNFAELHEHCRNFANPDRNFADS